MASTRITKNMADTIASEAIRDQYAKSDKDFAEAEYALAARLYETVYDAKTRAWAAKAPKGWIDERATIRVTSGRGYSLPLSLQAPRPHPTNSQYNGVSAPAELREEIEKHVLARDKSREGRSTVHTELVQTILQAGTLAKLEIAWPEGRAYYAAYANADKTKGTALTVPFGELNKKLGLPKDDKPAAKPKATKAA